MQTKSEKYLEFKTNMDKLAEEYNDELAEKTAEILSEISEEEYNKDFINFFVPAWKIVESAAIDSANKLINKAKGLTLEDLEYAYAVDRTSIYKIIYETESNIYNFIRKTKN